MAALGPQRNAQISVKKDRLKTVLSLMIIYTPETLLVPVDLRV